MTITTEDYIALEKRLMVRERETAGRAFDLAIDVACSMTWGGDGPYENFQHLAQQALERRGIEPTYRRNASRQKRKGISRALSRAVWDRDGWECVTCSSHVDLTVDHIVPLAKGGGDDFDNLQTLCRPCNLKKGTS